MTAALFAIRPEPGLSATLAAARALDLSLHAEPLFAIEPVAWEPVAPAEVDGLLVGSANAIRHGGAALGRLSAKPVYAVGDKTAEAAREAGFTVAAVGQGGLQPLLATLPGPQRLLRLAGEERIALAPPKGVDLVTRTVYRAAPLPMPDGFARQLARGGIVLIHSAAAMRHFAGECDRLSIARDRLALVVLAPRILETGGAGWAWTAAAREPADPALLVLARDMCLSFGGSKNGR